MIHLAFFLYMHGLAITQDEYPSNWPVIPTHIYRTKDDCNRAAAKFASEMSRRGLQSGWRCMADNEPRIPRVVRHREQTGNAPPSLD